MKTKFNLSILILFIASNFLYSQLKDVKGFMKTTWGMTEAQILDVMKDDVVKLKAKKNFGFSGAYATLGMKKYTIDSNDYVVHFVMDPETDVLKQVNLDIIYQNVEDSYKSFDLVKGALEKQYGKVTKDTTGFTVNPKNQEKSPFRKAVWVYPSTIVFLIYALKYRKMNKHKHQFFQKLSKC